MYVMPRKSSCIDPCIPELTGCGDPMQELLFFKPEADDPPNGRRLLEPSAERRYLLCGKKLHYNRSYKK